MAITTLDGLIGATKQKILWNKTGMSNVAAAGVWTSTWNMAGTPGAGSLTSTASAGSTPTQATTGGIVFTSAADGTEAYISKVTFAATQVGTWRLYDKMWWAGNLTPAAADYANCSSNGVFTRASAQWGEVELWCETAATLGAATYAQRINFQDASGAAFVGTVTLSQTAAPNMVPVNMSGRGCRAITSVSGLNAGTGSFNLMALRPLLEVTIDVANVGKTLDFTQTNLPYVPNNACMFWAWYGTTATEPTFWCTVELSRG